MFLIESAHTKEECLRALDELMAKSPERLDAFKFACSSGDHRGWAIVDAKNLEEAKSYVPEFVRTKATFREVSAYTPEQLRSFHQAEVQPQPTV